MTSTVSFNRVLRNKKEFEIAIQKIEKKNLPKHEDPPKNWHSLAAFEIITEKYPNDRDKIEILDAGGEFYSSILPMLENQGFRNLTCINLAILNKMKIGNIQYASGDITSTQFMDNQFDAITCLSVIEHGVDIKSFLQESVRILKPGGLLFISADYWSSHVDTENKIAFGCPLKIFEPADIQLIIDESISFGFTLQGDLDLKCEEKVIHSSGLSYTFIHFTLVKNIN